MTRTRHRYPTDVLLGDYARAGAGLLLTVGPPLVLDLSPAVTLLMLAGGLLFALFGMRTIQRHLTSFDVDDQAIAAQGPLGRTIAWRDLDQLKLSYYSTRRDRGHGWMQLTLKGQGGTIRMESTLDRFDEIAERAAAAARKRRLALTGTTVDNLAALGIEAAANWTMQEAG